jgi:hypothetical protein
METEGSSPHLQQPATCPYHEVDQASPCPSHLLEIRFNIILLSIPGSSKWSLSIRSSHKTLQAPLLFPLQDVCPAHHIILDLSEHKAPRYAVFFTAFFPLPSQVQISSSVPSSRKPSATFLPLRKRPSLTPIYNNGQNYSSVYL